MIRLMLLPSVIESPFCLTGYSGSVTVSRGRHSFVLAFEPSAGEAGATEAGDDVGALAHLLPDHPGAVVLDHADDGSLVDPQVIDVEPPLARHDGPLQVRNVGEGEGRVEGVAEAVLTVEVVAVALAHGLEGGDRHLWSEGNGPAHRGRGDGAVVADVARARPSGPVGVEPPHLAVDLPLDARGAIAGGEAPYILTVILPPLRVVNGISALRKYGPA